MTATGSITSCDADRRTLATHNHLAKRVRVGIGLIALYSSTNTKGRARIAMRVITGNIFQIFEMMRPDSQSSVSCGTAHETVTRQKAIDNNVGQCDSLVASVPNNQANIVLLHESKSRLDMSFLGDVNGIANICPKDTRLGSVIEWIAAGIGEEWHHNG